MIRGMRYSPVAGSRAVSISIVPETFMAEFQAMLAMYRNSVSIGYGSPRYALVITRCISPWAASGASQENALSIRQGVPSASTSRSSGSIGKPSGGPGSGRSGATSPGRPAGFGPAGTGFG
jgi:hypothetical protein